MDGVYNVNVVFCSVRVCVGAFALILVCMCECIGMCLSVSL